MTIAGMRKPQKPTAKEALARLEILETQNAMLKLDIRERTKNFLTQMQIFEGIFNAVLDQAATVGEARRWYSEWVSDVNALDINRDDYKQQLQAIIDKHGFEFSINDEGHGELLDKLWESKGGEL
jgi:hypothetical protein